jgi:glycyl-tRNA synthetase beta chain
LKPSGSKDPFALRRAAIGIIRILIENDLELPLNVLLRLGNKNLDFDDLIDFFNDRFRVHLSEKGLRHDVLNSIISKNYENVPLKNIHLRALAITAFVTTVAGKDLIQGYKRAANILSAEEKKDGVEYSLDPNPSLMRETSEKNLFQKLLEIEKIVVKDLVRKDLEAALENLANLRGPIDKFFNSVQINIDNSIIRRNRLCLLNRIKEVMHKVANFSKIDGEI